MKKRIICILLAAALLLCLGACGDSGKPYKIIENLGQKQFGSAYRTGDRLSATVNAAISVLAANGTLSAASTSWLGSDVICLDGDIEAINKLEIQIEPRTLIVGIAAAYKPLSYEENGSYKGMTVDIANAIGSLLGWEIKLQPIDNGDIASQLASGNIDCALGFGIETLSSSDFDIGECYMKSDIVVAVASDSGIKAVKDIKDKKVGTINDSSLRNAAEKGEKLLKYNVGTTLYLYPARCLSALGKDWCAAVVMDTILLDAYASAMTQAE